MPITALDHVNLQTTRLDEMIAWYRDLLEMPAGDRPDFSFAGAWLYAGNRAAVHLVEVATEQQAIEPKIEHFALTATDMTGFIARLDAHGVPHTIDPVPGFPIVQVNLRDPDGNHIHVDFDSAEAS